MKTKVLHGIYLRISTQDGQQKGGHVEYVNVVTDDATGEVEYTSPVIVEPIEKGLAALKPFIPQLVLAARQEVAEARAARKQEAENLRAEHKQEVENLRAERQELLESRTQLQAELEAAEEVTRELVELRAAHETLVAEHAHAKARERKSLPGEEEAQ